MYGSYAWSYWLLITCNVVIPQLLWSGRVRRSVPMLFGIAIVVLVGMWLERFVIVVTSLQRDFLPSSWGMYSPTFWDWATFLGTLGLFFSLLFLFVRVLPAISMSEMRELVEGIETERRE
jgi:molybdopterin-containing oxidoreductase family membrane subunit